MTGTHGTSLSRAKKIHKSQRFEVSEEGCGGSGAYFWAYETDRDYGIELAESWWAYANSKNRYVEDLEKDCAVLDAKFKCPPESNIFDASQTSFKEMIFRVIRDKKKNENDVPEITEVLIKEFEEEQKINYQLVKMVIRTPPKLKKIDLNSAQMASSHANAYLIKECGLTLIEGIDFATGGHHE